jgi:hypothetical protein
MSDPLTTYSASLKEWGQVLVRGLLPLVRDRLRDYWTASETYVVEYKEKTGKSIDVMVVFETMLDKVDEWRNSTIEEETTWIIERFPNIKKALRSYGMSQAFVLSSVRVAPRDGLYHFRVLNSKLFC